MRSEPLAAAPMEPKFAARRRRRGVREASWALSDQQTSSVRSFTVHSPASPHQEPTAQRRSLETPPRRRISRLTSLRFSPHRLHRGLFIPALSQHLRRLTGDPKMVDMLLDGLMNLTGRLLQQAAGTLTAREAVRLGEDLQELLNTAGVSADAVSSSPSPMVVDKRSRLFVVPLEHS